MDLEKIVRKALADAKRRKHAHEIPDQIWEDFEIFLAREGVHIALTETKAKLEYVWGEVFEELRTCIIGVEIDCPFGIIRMLSIERYDEKDALIYEDIVFISVA